MKVRKAGSGFVVAVCLLAGPSSASADCPPDSDCKGAALPAPASSASDMVQRPAAAPTVYITHEQVATFAGLVGQSQDVVTARLLGDPQLATAAMHAADAYESRKRSGKTLTITGAVVLGVTDVAAAVIIASAPGYPNNVDGDSVGQVLAGMAVFVVGQAVGFSLLIPGIVHLAAKSHEEKVAIEEYRSDIPPSPPPSAAPRPTAPTSGALTFPLLSLSF